MKSLISRCFYHNHGKSIAYHSLHYEKYADGTVKCIEDEIPFEAPAGWEWCRLSSISEAIGDGDHQPPPQTSSGIPFLVISNVSNGELSFENTRYVPKSYYDSLPDTRRPRRGDLLYTVTGSYGIPVLINTDESFCFQRHIAIIRPCLVTSNYLALVLGSAYIKAICDDKATGTAQKTVGLGTLRELPIPIAPLKEQERICFIAKEAMEYVKKIGNSKDELQHLIQKTRDRILDHAIRGKLVPQNPDDEPAAVLLNRIRAEKVELIKQGKSKRDKQESIIFRGEDNSYYRKQGDHIEQIDDQFLFDLPDGWSWCHLSDVAQCELGKTLDQAKNTGNYFPYLRSVNIRWDEVDVTDLKQMRFEPDEIERYTIKNGDLLICEGGDVGRSAVWCRDESILYQNALHRVRFWGNVNPRFFMYYLMYYESKGILKDICKGVTIKHLTGNVLNSLPFALPPQPEQTSIVAMIDRIFKILDAII